MFLITVHDRTARHQHSRPQVFDLLLRPALVEAVFGVDYPSRGDTSPVE